MLIWINKDLITVNYWICYSCSSQYFLVYLAFEVIRFVQKILIYVFSHIAATAQLTLVSVTKIFIPNGVEVTFNFSLNWKVEYCCRDNRCKFVEEHKFNFKGVSVNTHRLIIHNPDDESNGNYSCYGDSDPLIDTDLLLCLKITGEHHNVLTSILIVFPIKSVFFYDLLTLLILRQICMPLFITSHVFNFQVQSFPSMNEQDEFYCNF